jgi:cell division protein FtsB
VGKTPKPTQEEFGVLKTQATNLTRRVAELERHIADLEERTAALEAAARAFAVVYAIPRITPGDGGT